MKRSLSTIFLIGASALLCHAQGEKSAFDLLDTNDDGVLSPDEFSRLGETKKELAALEAISKSEEAIQAEMESAEEESALKKAAEYVSIRKSFLNSGDEALPAKFSWTNAAGASEFYTFDFAIQAKEIEFLYGPNWEINPTFEAHTSTQTGKTQDTLSVRVPATLILLSENPKILSHYFTASPVWETDRNQDNETLGGDLYYTIGSNFKYLGEASPIGLGNLEFRWRPWIGIEGGSYLSDGGIAATLGIDDYLRIVPKIQADLFLTSRFVLTAEYLHRTDLINDDSFDFFEASATYYLDPNELFSVGFTYKYGNTAPKFNDVDSVNAWLGVKF